MVVFGVPNKPMFVYVLSVTPEVLRGAPFAKSGKKTTTKYNAMTLVAKSACCAYATCQRHGNQHTNWVRPCAMSPQQNFCIRFLRPCHAQPSCLTRRLARAQPNSHNMHNMCRIDVPGMRFWTPCAPFLTLVAVVLWPRSVRSLRQLARSRCSCTGHASHRQHKPRRPVEPLRGVTAERRARGVACPAAGVALPDRYEYLVRARGAGGHAHAPCPG